MDKKFKAVVFDFDYTLADSSAGVIECYNYALRSVGLPEASDEAICKTIGDPIQKAFPELAGEQYNDRTDELIRHFRKRSNEVMADMTVMFDFTPAVLRKLKECGMLLGIVSTKLRYRIETILKREELLELFGAICGGEDVAEYKPDPAGLLTVIQKLGVSPSDALYVGDSVVDAETAERAGIAFVAVLSGVTPKGDFDGYPTYKIIKNISELPETIGM